MKTIQTELQINAPASKVWNILMDYNHYPNWNPFIKKLKGPIQEGATIEAKIHPPGQQAMTFKPVVLKKAKELEFRWIGKLFIKGLFDGEHYFILESIDANTTRFIHGENFKGLLVSLLLKMMGKNTLAGFHAMNAALKERAEKK